MVEAQAKVWAFLLCYTHVNQPIYQSTPDGGESYFVYNDKGQLRLSQNGRQKAASNANNGQVYSYTRYDGQGRTIEVGQVQGYLPDATAFYSSNVATYLANQQLINAVDFPLVSAYELTELTRTQYDSRSSGAMNVGFTRQEHLRNRVSMVSTHLSESSTETETYYSYDEHGNVDHLGQWLAGMVQGSNRPSGLFTMDYSYDLISGKVNQVSYQAGKSDQWLHRYKYDSDNRLKAVETSPNGIIWEEEAHYQYYLHGPLARVELAQDKVQGVDYSYTLQGWLKSINTPHAQIQTGSYALNTLDIGKDGLGGQNGFDGRVAQDEFSMALQYYQNDYTPIGSNAAPQGAGAWANPGNAVLQNGLYNGNIASWVTNYRSFGEKMQQPNNVQGLRKMSYRYDQLNRLVAGYNFFGDGTGNWQQRNIEATAAYDSKFSYDGNGNILTLQRAGATAALIDQLSYGYVRDANQQLVNNRLRHVKDGAGKFGDDIGSQVDDNYSYDGIGNLTRDTQDHIEIDWTVYGKVAKVTKTDGSNQVITYSYDATGNRVGKSITGGSDPKSTFYVRDASGNIMAIYEKKAAVTTLTEQPIYGSDRIGIYRLNLVIGSVVQRSLIAERGKKEYELKDHLGNVRVIVSDLKLGLDQNSDGMADTYLATVLSIVDYGAFGENLPGRQFNSNHGRYGFNGKEKDTDFSNNYDYGFRIYDARLGKFLSVDPLSSQFAFYSPYHFAGNSPIANIDLDGAEPKWFMSLLKLIGFDQIFHRTTSTDVEEDAEMQQETADRQAAFINVSESINNLYEAEKDAMQIVAPWMQPVFDVTDYKLGKKSGKDALISTGTAAAMEIIPFGKILGKTVGTGIELFRTTRIGNEILFIAKNGIGKLSDLGSAKIKDRLLELYFNVPEDLQKKGIGTKMFKEALKEFEDEFDGLLGQWVKGDQYPGGASYNLVEYKQAKEVLEPIKAVFETPTGRWARENGFGGVPKILKDEADEVKVIFTRDGTQ